METFEYTIVLIVEALAVFYVVRYFYRTFAESIRREGQCAAGRGGCGCGSGATKPVFKRDKPYVPPHLLEKDPGKPVHNDATTAVKAH